MIACITFSLENNISFEKEEVEKTEEKSWKIREENEKGTHLRAIM